MSDQRWPSPLQSPVNNNLDSMARVQVQPPLPAPSFLGRPEQRAAQLPTLPSISSWLNQPVLPARESPATRTPAKSSIHELLSATSSPSARSESGTPQYHPQQHPQPGYNVPPQPYRKDPIQTAYGRPPPLQTHVGQTQTQHLSQYRSPAPISATTQASSHFSSPASTSPSQYASQGVPFRQSQAVEELPYKFDLSIRQQPVAARACGFGERDRRVIDPPPILELKITDRETGHPEQDHKSMLALHCTLMAPDGEHDDTEVQSPDAASQAQRRLMGTLVASPYPAKDEHGVAGIFFVFPDLSCRSPGRFTLRFKLIRIDPTNVCAGTSFPCVANIVTKVFNVYTAKDFPGMKASSSLLVALRRQGLNVGVKKGSEARKEKGKTRKESGSSEEDDDSSDGGSEEERTGSRGTAASGSTGDLSPKTRLAWRKKPKRKRRDS